MASICDLKINIIWEGASAHEPHNYWAEILTTTVSPCGADPILSQPMVISVTWIVIDEYNYSQRRSRVVPSISHFDTHSYFDACIKFNFRKFTISFYSPWHFVLHFWYFALHGSPSPRRLAYGGKVINGTRPFFLLLTQPDLWPHALLRTYHDGSLDIPNILRKEHIVLPCS